MDFVEGLYFPFILIFYYTIYELPLYFIGKKNPELEQRIRKVARIAGICLALVLGFLLFVLPWLEIGIRLERIS